MEAIEGSNRDAAPLPPIKPLDKIIVAFAGPLFSFLLAFLAAVVVWKVGKPTDYAPTQTISEVEKDSPGEKAGLKVGDKITHINGKLVDGWDGRLDSIFMQIVTSKGQEIQFTVERPGVAEPLTLSSHFDIPETRWWQRKALRRVGIMPETGWVIVNTVMPEAPAARAGLEESDRIVSADGQSFKSSEELTTYIRSKGENPIQFVVERKKKPVQLTIQPRIPLKPEGQNAMIGVSFSDSPIYDSKLEWPGPVKQIADTLDMMWVTISRVASPSSSIGVSHLSGPVGIAKLQYRMLSMDEPWRRILAFMVLININLAILNMLPLPVLDGGHITLAILQSLMGRPVHTKILEVVQVGFVMLLMGLMLYVSSKDIFEGVGGEKKTIEYVFPNP